MHKTDFLAHLNLAPKPKEPKRSLKTSKSTKTKPNYDTFKIDESKIDPNNYIYDQILEQNGFKPGVYDTQSEIEPSLARPTPTVINFADIRLPMPKQSISESSSEENSCVYDYLMRTGGNCVPLDSFHHVLAQLKQTRAQLSSFQSVNSTQVQQNSLKFEFIYGETHYWIVKVKRFSVDLFQMKFIRSITSNGSCKKVDLNCTSDVSFNIDELNPRKNNEEELVSGELSPVSSRTTSPAPVETEKQVDNANDFNNNSNNNESESRPISSYSWLFSVSGNSVFSRLLRAQLKPLGWSKANGRTLKKPAIRLDNDLYQLLVAFGVDKMGSSQQNSVIRILIFIFIA